MSVRHGEEVATCCGPASVINCSVFTLHALLNSNICLDGIQPVCCNCLYRIELAEPLYDIHEAVV